MQINKISFGAKLDIPTMKIANGAIKTAFEEQSPMSIEFLKMWDEISDIKGEIFSRKKKNIEHFYFFCDMMKTPQLFFATHCENNAEDKFFQIYNNLQKVLKDLANK